VALADAPPPLRDLAQVVVHVTREVLAGDEPGAATLEEGPSLPRQTLLRLACDASLVTITEDPSGALLDAGRRTRVIPPAIRRALRSRDRGCRFPGCPQTRIVEAHHIRHWVARGRTALPNLIELCAFHHRLHHEGGFGITGTAGNLRFTRPDGRVIEAEPLGPRGEALVRSNARAGVVVTPARSSPAGAATGSTAATWSAASSNRGNAEPGASERPPKRLRPGTGRTADVVG
jgi:uncharacterized protein DUF222